MYIATSWDRKKPDPNSQNDRDMISTRARHLDRERREFIRTAAIELYASGECDLAEGAWAAAERLWNARPEGA